VSRGDAVAVAPRPFVWRDAAARCSTSSGDLGCLGGRRRRLELGRRPRRWRKWIRAERTRAVLAELSDRALHRLEGTNGHHQMEIGAARRHLFDIGVNLRPLRTVLIIRQRHPRKHVHDADARCGDLLLRDRGPRRQQLGRNRVAPDVARTAHPYFRQTMRISAFDQELQGWQRAERAVTVVDIPVSLHAYGGVGSRRYTLGVTKSAGDQPNGPGTVGSRPAAAGDAEAALTASRVLVAIAARSLAAAGEDITLPQYRALVVLAAHGPQQAVELAAALGITSSSATRLCDRLVKKDLVFRRRDVEGRDRRSILIGLTDAGRHFLDAVTVARRAEMQAIIERIPASERAEVVKAFQRFADAADEPADAMWSAHPAL